MHQDLGLVGAISTIENLALTTGYQTGVGRRIKWRGETRRAQDAMAALGITDIDVKAPVATLAPAQKTAVAIARALVGWEQGTSLLVLDEPTATLPGQDVSRLFDVIHRLKATGISILYVSHHLDEVFALADRVTVLRDAHRVTTVAVSTLNHQSLIELIVGHRIAESNASNMTPGEHPMLKVAGLSGGNVASLDLDVRAGEIVGLAGITGSGREHVLGLIAGQIRRTGGDVGVDATPVPSFSPHAGLTAGLAFVPSDRSVRGTIGAMTVRENLTLCDLSPFVEKGRLRSKLEKKESSSWIDTLSIKTTSAEAGIGSLSGGNQQKVMFSKALRLKPKVLLLDEPTQGIDVGAKDQIYRLVDSAAFRVAVVVASSDTEELVRLCHRVVVLVDGRAVAELVGAEITAKSIEHIQLQTSQGTK